MTIGWVLLGLVGWALGLGFTYALMRMAGDEDRAALRLERRLRPRWVVTIAHFRYRERIEAPSGARVEGRAAQMRRAA